MAELAGLRAEDLPELKAAYVTATNLARKETLTWALGVVGDEETVQLFQKTLLSEYAGKVLVGAEGGLGHDEATVMETTISALGLLASQHDSAWDFLRQGIDPWFWRQHILWESSYGGETVGLLTGASIQALSLSARPEVEALMNLLQSQPLFDATGTPPELARGFAGDVHQAAFYLSIVHAEGADAFKRWFFAPSTDVVNADEHYPAWTSSPDGQKWGEWYGKKSQEIILRRERMAPPTLRR